jgi:hypothetical protein
MLTAAAVPVTTGVSFVRFERLTPMFRMYYAPYSTEPDMSSGTTGTAPNH